MAQSDHPATDGRTPLHGGPVPPCVIGAPCPPPPPTFEESFVLRTEEAGPTVPASIKTLVTGERVFSPDRPLEPDRG